MKFTIEMNVHELSWSIQSGTLEGFVKNVKSYEDEVRNDKQTASVPETGKNEPKVEEHAKNPELGSEVNEEQSITIEDVRAAFIAKNSKANTTKLKAILNDFGVKKVTDLKKSDYPEVLKALEAI